MNRSFTDARLRTSRASDLDALVAEFQEVDKRLVQAAAGAVIEVCNARRPRNFAGGAAGVITRQAQMKRRHMPVRELLGRTRDVVRAIKPCFMMSPLTVSRSCRIRANIQQVLRGLQGAGRVIRDGEFWDVPGRACVTARRPSDQVRRPVGRISPV